MPPLILVAAGAIGAIAAVRWLRKEAARINAELHPEDVVKERGAGRRLVRDPVTGHYRPE
jgi:hypothetical protein